MQPPRVWMGRKEESQQRVGRRILDALNAVDMNQAGLAARLKKSPAQVSRWVNGESEISISELERVAEILGRNVGFFLGAPEPDPNNIAGDALSRLKPEHQEAVRALIETYRTLERKEGRM